MLLRGFVRLEVAGFLYRCCGHLNRHFHLCVGASKSICFSLVIVKFSVVSDRLSRSYELRWPLLGTM